MMPQMYHFVEEPFAAWLGARAADTGPSAYLLLQGYPYTGFALFENGELRIPAVPGTVTGTEWNLYSDVRLFDGEQEWHCWRAGGRWRFRHARKTDWTGIERVYVLWGNDKGSEQTGLFRLDSEDRGAKVYLPASAVANISAPAGLRMLLRVEYEENTGIAGITDAMIVGFERPQQYPREE